MVAQQCECTQQHWTLHLQMIKMIYCICIPYHNLQKEQQQQQRAEITLARKSHALTVGMHIFLIIIVF